MMTKKVVSLKEVLAEIDTMPPVKAEGHDFIEKTCLKTRIELLPSAQPEPQWIPVTERLPDEKTAALITTNSGYVVQCMYWGVQNGHHTWRSIGGVRLYWEMDVMAWMPLPEPYKGEK